MTPQPSQPEAPETTAVADEPGCAQFQRAVELIGRRWSGAILFVMLGGATRFSEIRERVPGLSDRLLSERLREFEALGLVRREVTPSVPVQVRYHLTEMARELIPVIQTLVDWSRRWLPSAGRRGAPSG